MNKERIDEYVQSFLLKLIYDRVKAGAIWEWKLWIVRVYTCVFMKVKTIMKHVVAFIRGCLKLLNTLTLNFMAEATDLL